MSPIDAPSEEYQASRERMVRTQLESRGIDDPRVLAAMARVPREQFVPLSARRHAYADRALPIECDQTISQPYIVALMSQALELTGSEKVLEIGTGSGYQTAILAELAREVITVERHPVLSSQAEARLSALGYRNVTLLVDDGTRGCPDRAPFDRITVTAAAGECPPALLAQLARPGILVIPVGSSQSQVLQAIHKKDDSITTIGLSPCRFVPLISGSITAR